MSTAPSTWDQTAFEALMNAEAKDRRASRKIFVPDTPQNKYLKNVDNYVTTPGTTPNTFLLSIGAGLQPMTVKASLSVSVDAQDDPGLRAFAARQLGDAFCFAEDAITLLGSAAAVPAARGPVTFTIDQTTLRLQLGLFSAPPLAAAPNDVAKGQVIASVVTALNNLRGRGHHGPFVVIVGTDLNEEAWTPIAAGIIQAPIYAVLPELRSADDGWIWSDVVPSRQGVVISLGGETFDFMITYDPHVESAIVNPKSFDIGAALQFRLRINDTTAIESLA